MHKYLKCKSDYVTNEALKPVSTKIKLFCHVTPCTFVHRYRRFETAYSPQCQGIRGI